MYHSNGKLYYSAINFLVAKHFLSFPSPVTIRNWMQTIKPQMLQQKHDRIFYIFFLFFCPSATNTITVPIMTYMRE